MQPVIRPYRPADLDAVYDICVRTADSGGDSRGTTSSDRLVGDIFAVPYVTLEPEHAHVLDDGTGAAVGYVLGTADTARFARRYRDEWLPATAGRYPEPQDPPVTADDRWLVLHHHPERMVIPALADYPAHLHIDLLPEWQGKGQGRGLIGAFLAGLREAGVARVHLGMSPSNTGARAFYDRLGFRELTVPDVGQVTFLGRTTDPL
ncbi:GNAT family N-acetyltransferase [Winogradskya humida]|uniref:Acetyltransferase n=1 Tax=Winogradskya humida TaxID=113566 RepID=A0ABQ3ZFC0_9ACTN|nr:GNAT family N-acetyltransferase [Actinoplanes humidus]GIE17276.1 acetyltransferase [Actinoplanes humidus]